MLAFQKTTKNRRHRMGPWRLILALWLFLTVNVLVAKAESDPPPAALDPASAAIFSKRCTGCHTFGKGIRVGPDLKGATDRHPRAWLLRFIHSSQTVIQSGDPDAVALFNKFKQQRMPDHELTQDQIGHLIDYLAAGGPEVKPANEKDAATASVAEIEQGRKLFFGETRFVHSGAPCASCHSVQAAGGLRGGKLGPDLTGVYAKYRDQALTISLLQTCILRNPEASTNEFLTPKESFHLKAYLRQIALPEMTHRSSASPAKSGGLENR